MALPSIRRRIGALEAVMPPVVDYPPFSSAEVEAIAERVQAGDWLRWRKWIALSSTVRSFTVNF